MRKDYGLHEIPISDVKRPKVPDERNIRLANGDEERLLKALDCTRNPWVKPLVLLALETAMRRGELLSLKWDRIDLAKKTAHLPETKTDRERYVPLSLVKRLRN